MRTVRSVLLALAWVAGASRAAAEAVTLVVCAPGYPGSTAEAQPAMDALASAASETAGWGKGGLAAVYHESEAAGLERLGQPDAALGLLPLPFFLQHQARLKLTATAQAVPEGGEASEVWSLVAAKGRVASPASLDGWELWSLAAYAPRFLRGPVLGAWGGVPGGTRLVPSGALLSGLRRAAAGDKVALLLDRAQAAALHTLPFAQGLEVVTRSAPLPGVVVCTVAGRLLEARTRALVKGLLTLDQRPDGATALRGVRLARFVSLDEAGLRRAREAFARAPVAP